MGDNQIQRLSEEIQFTSDMALVLFQSSPDAIVVSDADGKIRMVNPQAELLFGWHHSEMRGQPVEMLLPEEYRKRHADHRRTFLDDPRVRPMGISLHLQALRKDEKRVDVDINLSPVVTAHGLFVIATIRRTRPGERPAHTVTPSISSAP
jgi:PAS domain S-box-containing protein